MLNTVDLTLLEKKGIKPSEVQKQIDYFKQGFPWMKLDRAASIGNGIIHLSDADVDRYVKRFEEAKKTMSILKMVPASGAATRMFKSLFEHLSEAKPNKESSVFFDRLSEFAFAPELKKLLPEWSTEQEILENLLLSKGLDYGSLPKGLLSFHYYEDEVRTPLEEHLVEAVEYASDGKDAYLHFTVSPEHRSRFDALVTQVVPKLEKKFQVKFHISFSEQKPSTDTVAVDMDNNLFREADGSMLFRPAGHGALLENLNDLDADLIFIKNIDNVVPDKLKESTIVYKKALGGLLVEILDKIKVYTKLLEGEVSTSVLQEIQDFATTYLGILPGKAWDAHSQAEKLALFKMIFNRPTRICGVVKNTGEPGGGPFWCRDQEGNSTLQLVESAQVDMSNESQKAIFTESTHFNPVDLVCATKDVNGKSFDLLQYRDMSTGFITEKTKDGKKLKAQELPGLWNGAMAYWNTIFVEVPLDTFNPVKTVNDLLRPSHQN
ncbi:DUF4301 family protein [Aquirufa ecclesiirivi]|uniref:DUF4301 family protein n=1 Tax=Aquirufa ecclesiirivi TaxID=2715124 RepID=A0ABT4JGE7_9BACT|nr:DUF4301 family protein [Aquirufa ecclesiirivi]MCZ2475318.1 DUF4301 family protein [Aquirufa ecclesiirivi]